MCDLVEQGPPSSTKELKTGWWWAEKFSNLLQHMKAKRLQELHNMQERGTIRRAHIIEMLDEIRYLREQINTLGEWADICVQKELGGDICYGCRCGKSDNK